MEDTPGFLKPTPRQSPSPQDHSFSVGLGAELTFETGIPIILEFESKISINMNTIHTWRLTETNTTQNTFSTSSNVKVPAGKCIHIMASVSRKAQWMCRTVLRSAPFFGYETYINGIWKGVTHYSLMVS